MNHHVRIGTRRSVAAVAAIATVGAAASLSPIDAAHAAGAATTVQVTVRSGGFEPGWGANNQSMPTEHRLVSADGRYVVAAVSGPVVQGQNEIAWQVVRRDRQLGRTELISRSSTGAIGNGASTSPSISADGQVVAFHSYATNLVPGDTNNQSDVFVHDVRTGTTTRVNVTSSGSQVTASAPGDNPTGPPSISADGRYVGFTSTASGLAAGDSTSPNGYLHDRTTRTTEVVSRSHTGAVVDVMPASTVSVSSDGGVVAFYSGNASVVPGDTNGDPDVFVRTRGANPGPDTTEVVYAGIDGSSQHSLSADGRYVVFRSTSPELAVGDTNGVADIYVHDWRLDTTQRVSISSNGAEANAAGERPAISADGRYVTFHSAASNLVSGDTNGRVDVFRHDRTTGTTIRVSVTDKGGQNPSDSTHSSISGDGQHVTFESYEKSLTPAGTAGYGQVFVRDLAGKYPALFARLGSTPGRVIGGESYAVRTVDIRTGPALAIVWTPTGGGAAVRQSAAVSGNTFALRAPKPHGAYRVTVHYDGNLLGTRTITVVKPGAKKLPAAIKKGKKLKVRTVGVARGTKVNVRFKPTKSTGGKAFKRVAKTNKKGVAAVRTVKRTGKFRVTVKAGKTVLRKGTVRLR